MSTGLFSSILIFGGKKNHTVKYGFNAMYKCGSGDARISDAGGER
jgi:hypothetical protein